jgi:8-oxo-dGTP pyrophosphatase MutT (NUDIX family)
MIKQLKEPRETYKHYVVGFCFDPTYTQIVLVKKCKPIWQNNLLNGVGGQIEGNETPEQAMEREFWEETGLKVKHWTLFLTGDLTIHQGNCVVHYLLSHAKIKSCKYDAKEQCGWYDYECLPDNIVPNILWLIPMAKLKVFYRDWSEPAQWASY